MKFIQVNIYGFGKWVDQTIDLLDHPLQCFYGENESGKTTLQQFILYVLFGLPPRKLAPFKPVYSNKIGGRLTVEDGEIGRYQIERIEQDVICYLPTGELRDETWLQKRLHGINRDIYTSIYSFSALQLTEIRQMKQDQLSDVLFSVGLTGSTSIYKAEKDIETKIGKLFKAQGRVPIINKQLHVVKEGNAKLIERQQKEVTYQDKQVELNRLMIELEDQSKTERQIKSDLMKTEKTLHVLPQMREYKQYRNELNNHQARTFPEDGVERLKYWQEKLLPLKGELRVVHMQLQKDALAAQKIEASLYNEAMMDMTQKLVQQKPTYEYLVQEEHALKTKIGHVQEELTIGLAKIKLEEASIIGVEFPFYLEKNWRQLQQTQELLLQRDESQTEHYETLQNKKSDIEQSIASYDQMEKADVVKQDNKHVRKKELQEDKWQQWKEHRMKMTKGILFTAITMAILSLLFALYKGNAILLTLPLIILLAGILQYVNMKNTLTFLLQDPMHDGKTTNSHDIATSASRREEQSTFKTPLQSLEEQLRQVEIEVLQWKAQQKAFLKKENKWIQLIEVEQQTYPFLQHIEIDYWLDLLSEIRNIQQQHTEKVQMEQELLQVQSHIKEIEREKKIVSDKLTNQEVSLSFAQIQDMIEKQHTDEHFLEQYREQIVRCTKEMEALKEKVAVYDEEVNKLFMYAQVKDEEAYLQLASDVNRQQTIRAEMERIEQSLMKLLSEQEFDRLLQQTMDENDLTLRQNMYQKELSEIEQQQTALNKSIATIEMEINQLELSEDHSTAIYQQQVEQDTLQQMARKWASLKVAQSALEAAKTSYQKHHLDEVVQQTSRFFKTITDGTYNKVIAPDKKTGFQVEDQQQIRYTVDKLSQGTIDQLYVSLRLAISIVMSKTYHMPFIMDDAFVHFDAIRMQNMIRVLTSIRQEQQIIVFTCRKDIAEAFEFVHTLN